MLPAAFPNRDPRRDGSIERGHAESLISLRVRLTAASVPRPCPPAPLFPPSYAIPCSLDMGGRSACRLPPVSLLWILILCLVQRPMGLVQPMSCNTTGKKKEESDPITERDLLSAVVWHHLSVSIWPLWLAAIIPLFFLLAVVPPAARFLNVKRNSDSR